MSPWTDKHVQKIISLDMVAMLINITLVTERPYVAHKDADRDWKDGWRWSVVDIFPGWPNERTLGQCEGTWDYGAPTATVLLAQLYGHLKTPSHIQPGIACSLGLGFLIQ